MLHQLCINLFCGTVSSIPYVFNEYGLETAKKGLGSHAEWLVYFLKQTCN